MKYQLKLLIITVFLSSTIIIGCQKNSTYEDATVEEINSNNDSFESVIAIFDEYESWYSPGDELVIKFVNNSFYVMDELHNSKSTLRSHTISNKNKLDFARECDSWLKNNKAWCLKVGYDDETKTYWADKIAC